MTGTQPPAGIDLPPAAARFRQLLLDRDHPDTVVALPDSARTAAEAAAALGTTADRIASSLVFGLTPELPAAHLEPLLIVTSGGHRVDTLQVAEQLGVPKLHRVDAAFVRAVTGYSIGGVAPIGWRRQSDDFSYCPLTLIDRHLDVYGDLWAAAGHPHCVFRTSYPELVRLTAGRPTTVA